MVLVPSDGWKELATHILYVNAYALDAGQEGLDLREWHGSGTKGSGYSI